MRVVLLGVVVAVLEVLEWHVDGVVALLHDEVAALGRDADHHHALALVEDDLRRGVV